MKSSNIPSTFRKLFAWFCNPDLYEELQGDLEEAFEENQATLGLSKARAIYRREVLKMIRPSVIRSWVPARYNHTVLFKNYFKTSYRAMIKNPMTSFINVFGLAVAIGICLVVYTFFKYDRSLDQFHVNKDKVYLATFFVDRDGNPEQYGTTPTPLAEMLKQDFAQISKTCRVEDRNVVIKFQDNVFHESVRYVDPEFLEIFTFPLQWGLSSSLGDVNSIILSEEMSIKYFGEQNPIGQDIQLIYGENQSKTFRVTGVAAPFPKAHVIEFDFLINFENFKITDNSYDWNDWSRSVNATLIQVENPTDLEAIQAGMSKYKDIQNQVQTDWAIQAFSFESLATLHWRSANIRNGISFDDNIEARLGLPIIAVIMLVLACLNYMNIAVVTASRRLKEIGLRKVIGANKGLIATQFLTENIVVTSFALLMGVILAVSVFIPWLNQLSGWPLEMKMIDPEMWIFLVTTVVVVGLVSGIYPSFYVSKFEAVKIFKGSIRLGKKNVLTKLFLAVQLILTCAGITCAVLFNQNNSYQNSRDWGYDQHNTLYAKVADQSAYDRLSTAMAQQPNVLSRSGSAHHLGEEIASAVLHFPDRKYEVRQLSVDANYFETMGLEITTGRAFEEHRETDNQKVLVNEELVESFGLVPPIGETFQMDSTRYEVIGVVKDFHIYSFADKIRPTIFSVATPSEFRYLSMRIKPGTGIEAYQSLQANWAEIFPEIPFQGGHQEDVWSRYFEMLNTAERFYRALALIAVILASLGLYGLVTLNVAGRTQEFSIRKTLGAGITHLAKNIANQYVILFVVSLIIGIPFSYMLGKASLDMLYAYPMPVGYSGLTISLTILLAVLLLVVSTQIRKVVNASPVKGLRSE